MHQLVKLTDAIWLLQLTISFPLIHALGDPTQAPKSRPHQDSNLGWKVDDLSTELSLPLNIMES